MPCEGCSVQFSVFKRKRICGECDRFYCGNCLRRGGGMMCGACRILLARPLGRQSLGHLKVRDLQYFLHRQNVSTRGCVEREDLVNLVISHVNSGSYRRKNATFGRKTNDFSNAFNTLKGITTNLNNLINSAFDMRSPATFNESVPHDNQEPTAHASAAYDNTAPSTSGHTTTARVNVTPSHTGSSPDNNDHINIESSSRVPNSTPEIVNIDTFPDSTSEQISENSEHRDTADCLEIEDLDDAVDWEFVNRPAEPLPSDSSVLIEENVLHSLTNRAASELNLHRSESNETITDTSSLKDEPIVHHFDSTKRIQLEDIKLLSQLEFLNVKQLKELLVLNRVDFKGCVERAELLERAKRLWNESAKSKEDLNSMPLEDMCKICMDAPMECVMLECGHIATCTACGKRLSECPICRQYVVRVVRFFRS